MSSRSSSLLVLPVLGIFMLASARSAEPKKETTATAKPAESALAKKLKKKVSLEKGIDANTPLQDVLDFLADRYDVTFVVDTKAFEAAGVQKVTDQPIQLKPVKEVALGKVLQTVLDQVQGTYRVEKDKVVVLPKPEK
jgi:hypothetical protein